MSEYAEIVSEIAKKVKELNDLFEKAASESTPIDELLPILRMFECSFEQNKSFKEGMNARLKLKAYMEIS